MNTLTGVPPLRKSEWLSLFFFAYVATLAPFFGNRPHLGWQPLAVLSTMLAVNVALAYGERFGPAKAFSFARDWVPIATTLVAFQEMDLFQPVHFDHIREAVWIRQDIALLGNKHLQRAMQPLGALLPFYLESCYLLVYGIAAFSVAVLYLVNKRPLVDHFYVLYLAGTLGAYACFPFFPSEPPRYLYPDVAMPAIVTWMRSLNLWLLRKATIHVSVFPSAHVSSAFSAAWALLVLLPEKRVYGGVALAYAVSVALATIYGRYHYTADALAGIGISVAAVLFYAVFAALAGASVATQGRSSSLTPPR